MIKENLNKNEKIDLHSKLETYALFYSYLLKYGSDAKSLSPEDALKHKGAESSIYEDGYTHIKPLCADKLQPLGIYVYVAYDSSSDNPKPAKIFCRGTQSDASLIADFDYYGPGYSAVVANRVAILKELEEALAETSTSELELTGHSLGGSVSQLLLWMISIEKRYAPETAKINQIESVTLSTFHSAPVSKEVALFTSDNIRKIYNDGAKKSFDVSIRHHQTAFDPVNISSLYIGHDLSLNHADVELVRSSLSVLEYMQSFLNLSAIQHSSLFYSEKRSISQSSKESVRDFAERKHTTYSNSVPRGRDKIRNYIAPKSYDLPKFFGSIHGLIKGISTPVLKLGYIIFNIIYKLVVASAFILAAIILPTFSNIAFAANSVRDFLGYLLQFFNESFTILKQQANSTAATVFSAEKASVVNKKGVDRVFDVYDLNKSAIIDLPS